MKKFRFSPFSPKMKLLILSILLGFTLFAYVRVNERIENGSFSDNTEDYVDMSSCNFEVLDESRIRLTVPGAFSGDTTQKSLDRTCTELGYESITLNKDGSITYLLSREQHQEMLSTLKYGILATFQGMVGNGTYKHIASIEANESITYIKVTLDNVNTSYSTSLSMIQFKTYFQMYHAFEGTPDATLTVEYYNKDGSLVATCSCNAM